MTTGRLRRRIGVLVASGSFAAVAMATSTPRAPDPGPPAEAAPADARAAARAEPRPPDVAPEPSTTAAPGTVPEPVAGGEMVRQGAPTPSVDAPRAVAITEATAGTVAPPAPITRAAVPVGPACLVTLHGKGGSGAPTQDVVGIRRSSPAGNAAGWGGRQWSYDDAASFSQARAIVQRTVDEAGCSRVVIHGFSNGASFAAKLYCTGESLGGRLLRVVVDDPVTDAGVLPCTPSAGVALTLYWTGALAVTAPAGWVCASADWTCAGGSSIGIVAYAAALRVASTPSPMGTHAAFDAAPELAGF